MATALQVTSLPGKKRSFSAKQPAKGPPVVGGNDDYCVLLLEFEDDEGSTNIVDTSAGGLPKTITPYEQARIVNTEQQYGVGSLYCDGAQGCCVVVDPSQDFRFDLQDFGIDFWVYVIRPIQAYLFAWHLDDDNYLALECIETKGDQARFQFRFVLAGVVIFNLTKANVWYDLSSGWHHVAISRLSGGRLLFWDGTLKAIQATPGGADAVNVDDWPLYIGAGRWANKNGLYYLDGYVDEFRVMRGQAPFVAPFDPYGNPYTRRFAAEDRGAHYVRRRFQGEDRGVHGVIYHPFVGGDRGGHHVCRTFTGVDRGAHAVHAVFQVGDRGVHGVVRREFVGMDRGVHHVQRTFAGHDRGAHGILSGPFIGEERGMHYVWQAFEQHDRGDHRCLTAFQGEDRGLHAIHALGAPPDLTGVPTYTFSILPYETPAITGEGVHYFVLRRRNQWGLVSRNTWATLIELNADDDEIMRAPSEPAFVQISPIADGAVRVEAVYYYGADDDRQADQWLLYVTDDGGDPDPDVDEPIVIDMNKRDGAARLVWTSSEYDEDDVIKILVRTQRSEPARASQNLAFRKTIAVTQPPSTISGLTQWHRVDGLPVEVM